MSKWFTKNFLEELQKKCSPMNIDEYMERTKLSFHDAVVNLAETHGVEVQYLEKNCMKENKICGASVPPLSEAELLAKIQDLKCLIDEFTELQDAKKDLETKARLLGVNLLRHGPENYCDAAKVFLEKYRIQLCEFRKE